MPDATTARVSATLDQLVDVETPEQVAFSYTIAGVGSRAAAALIDYAIVIGIFILLAILWAQGLALLPRGAGEWLAKVAEAWAFAFFVIVQFVLQWGYYILFEALRDGQTPGKKRLGLRVVQDGGYSVSFSASAVRNLVRILDMQPGFLYGVGILSAAISKSGKRLGDMVAGTIVVRERVTPHAPAEAQRARVGAPTEPVPALAALLTDDEYALLERYVARRQSLDPDRRSAIAEQLGARFLRHFATLEPAPTLQAMLVRLFERERAVRARGAPARSDTGAAREQHAIVAQNAARWADFAALLADAQRRGLRHMSEEEVSHFVARYREMTTDLARLRTAARGRDLDALFYLSRLVAGGHNLLYRQRELMLDTVWRYMTVTVPREVRRSWRPILLAATLFFGPLLVSWRSVVAHPQVAHDFLPPGMIDRAEQGVRRAKLGGEGYIDDPGLFQPVMASGIIANNVQVTFVVFAAGVTAGVFTVLMLVVNGVQIGGVLGLYQSKGILDQLLAFAAPHSVFELSAICVAGGGGFLIAHALLFPGALTRREALVRQSRWAMRLIAASTVLLVLAGTLEGFISPREDWLLWQKGYVALVCFLLLIFFVTRGRTGTEAPVEENAYLTAARIEN
jgi:uncharacterized membrane protein SpoIIM required for sporulation/uncharacterized RDD family membrane protein YckC